MTTWLIFLPCMTQVAWNRFFKSSVMLICISLVALVFMYVIHMDKPTKVETAIPEKRHLRSEKGGAGENTSHRRNSDNLRDAIESVLKKAVS